MPMFSFYTPGKQKARGFMTLGGGRGREHWHGMGGYYIPNRQILE